MKAVGNLTNPWYITRHIPVCVRGICFSSTKSQSTQPPLQFSHPQFQLLQTIHPLQSINPLKTNLAGEKNVQQNFYRDAILQSNPAKQSGLYPSHHVVGEVSGHWVSPQVRRVSDLYSLETGDTAHVRRVRDLYALETGDMALPRIFDGDPPHAQPYPFSQPIYRDIRYRGTYKYNKIYLYNVYYMYDINGCTGLPKSSAFINWISVTFYKRTVKCF